MKRLFDIGLSLLTLLVLSPILLGAALAVFIDSGAPVFFRQTRVGKGGQLFGMFKFRSMRQGAESTGPYFTQDNDVRITRVGKFIRRTSIDELPQLINVLRGDISLIGPRPLLTEYLPLYNAAQRRRHQVRPGITGWAQVNGRNTISWERKFDYDIHYVDNLSFGLDAKIFFLTILKILKGEGISADNSATMEKFKGEAPSPERKQKNSIF